MYVAAVDGILAVGVEQLLLGQKQPLGGAAPVLHPQGRPQLQDVGHVSRPAGGALGVARPAVGPVAQPLNLGIDDLALARAGYQQQ